MPVALIFAAFGAGITLLRAPFALAAIVPFGTARRILVGLGAAAVGDIFFAVALGGGGGVLGVFLTAGFFWLAYRIAR